MAVDEERLQEKARKVSAHVRKSLKQARTQVTATHGQFQDGFFLNSPGKGLEKHKSYSSHYRELQAALKGVEAAIARAEAACDALDAAPKP